MKSIRFNELNEESAYVIDLVQLNDGTRFVHIRSAFDLPHPSMVLTSVLLGGDKVRCLLMDRRMDESVVTESGKTFGLDAHGSWMLLEELKFWQECRKQQTDWVNGPWVNGKPPKFAPM